MRSKSREQVNQEFKEKARLEEEAIAKRKKEMLQPKTASDVEGYKRQTEMLDKKIGIEKRINEADIEILKDIGSISKLVAEGDEAGINLLRNKIVKGLEILGLGKQEKDFINIENGMPRPIKDRIEGLIISFPINEKRVPTGEQISGEEHLRRSILEGDLVDVRIDFVKGGDTLILKKEGKIALELKGATEEFNFSISNPDLNVNKIEELAGRLNLEGDEVIKMNKDKLDSSLKQKGDIQERIQELAA